MSDLPEPLVPDEVDLRTFPYMPLDVQRLLNSEFYAIATDAEYRAGTTLWFSSWHERPASSLPDDDRVLCNLARLGRDMRTWRKVKAVAMHGFLLCSDGRWYHPIVAEKAMKAWAEKQRRAKQTEAARKLDVSSVDRGVQRNVDNDDRDVQRNVDQQIQTQRIELRRDPEAPPASGVSPHRDTGTPPPVVGVATRLPTMEERQESREELIARQQEELRARNGHTKADEIAAIKAVTDPAAVDDETGAGRTAEGARGEGEDGQASDAEHELELPAGGGGGHAEGV